MIQIDVNEFAEWERKIYNSENYKQIFNDYIRFSLQGISNETKLQLELIQNSRVGFIAELFLEDGRVIVFPSPVFLSKTLNKKENSRAWDIELNYRVLTFKDFLLNSKLSGTDFLTASDTDLIITADLILTN